MSKHMTVCQQNAAKKQKKIRNAAKRNKQRQILTLAFYGMIFSRSGAKNEKSLVLVAPTCFVAFFQFGVRVKLYDRQNDVSRK